MSGKYENMLRGKKKHNKTAGEKFEKKSGQRDFLFHSFIVGLLQANHANSVNQGSNPSMPPFPLHRTLEASPV